MQTSRRRVRLSGAAEPVNHQNNLVKNTKYNLVTFVPKVLYNQFKFFYNMFFLVTALTQLVELLRVGLFITYIGPLIMVLTLTMAKEAYDDFNTYKRDIEVTTNPRRPTPSSTTLSGPPASRKSRARTSKSETSSKSSAETGFRPTW